VPQPGLNGRKGYQPRGKGLGGSSAINAMCYIRGHKADYDRWAAMGNAGWSYADVLPYFKRSEDNSEFDGVYHGKGGPLSVTKLQTDNPVQEIYLQAAREAQFRINEDFNGEEQEGLGVYQVTQKNGERWSSARGYVHPFMGNAQESARDHRRTRNPHPVRRQARDRHRISSGQGDQAGHRAPGNHSRPRRFPDTATPDAVRHRRPG
jgi:choline dehydrogenase-like flavoprotein